MIQRLGDLYHEMRLVQQQQDELGHRQDLADEEIAKVRRLSNEQSAEVGERLGDLEEQVAQTLLRNAPLSRQVLTGQWLAPL